MKWQAMLHDITLEPIASPRAQRADGAEARERLLRAALRLFADKGFAKASTREIAQAAGTNIAAISYYFGDKAGLYRASFRAPSGAAGVEADSFDRPALALRESLQAFFRAFLEPLKQGEWAQLGTRLRLREFLEPTGLLRDGLDQRIQPIHAGLSAVLCRALGLAAPDDDVHRLAFAIVGLAMQPFVSRDAIDAIRPQLLASPQAIDSSVQRLADYAQAMTEFEQRRRSAADAEAVPPRRAAA